MSEQQSQAVYEKRGQADNPASHGRVMYHLLPEAKLREPGEGPLSLEDQHLRSQQVALGQRRMQETPEETAAREAQEAADRAEWEAEKERRAAAAKDSQEMAAYLAQKRTAEQPS